jgi:hypothetical protein
MHFTRPRDLLFAGLIGLVLAFGLFQLAYGSLPRLPLGAGATLAALAVLEFALAFPIRARIRRGRVDSDGIGIARAVALAKASSVLGGLMSGIWLGIIAYLLPRQSRLPAAVSDMRSAVIGLVSALLLVGAALWLEQCCRTPKPRDQDRSPDSTG